MSFYTQGFLFYLVEGLFVRLVEPLMTGFEHESWPLLVTGDHSAQDFKELLLLLSHFKVDCQKMKAEKKCRSISLVAVAHGGPALEQDGSTLIQFMCHHSYFINTQTYA